MTKYNTGNPVGSSSPLDLYDNAENLDNGINGTALTWLDRRGVTRKSFAGIETDFQQFLADGSTIEFPTWVAANSAAGAGEIPLNRQVAVIGDAGSHIDPVSGQPVPNSGRYVMGAAGLQWRSQDVLSQKADLEVVVLTSGNIRASALPRGQALNGATLIMDGTSVAGFNIPAGTTGANTYIAADFPAVALRGKRVRIVQLYAASAGWLGSTSLSLVRAQYLSGSTVNILATSDFSIDQAGTVVTQRAIVDVPADADRVGLVMQIASGAGSTAGTRSLSLSQVGYSFMTSGDGVESENDLALEVRMAPLREEIGVARGIAANALLTSGDIAPGALPRVVLANGATNVLDSEGRKVGFQIAAGQTGGTSYMAADLDAKSTRGQRLKVTQIYTATAGWLAVTPLTGVRAQALAGGATSNLTVSEFSIVQDGTTVTQTGVVDVPESADRVGLVIQISPSAASIGAARSIQLASAVYEVASAPGSGETPNDVMLDARLDPVKEAAGVYRTAVLTARAGTEHASPAEANQAIQEKSATSRSTIFVAPGTYAADFNWTLAPFATLKAQAAERPIIHYELPDSSTESPANYQPFWIVQSGAIDGIKVTARNARYAVHCEASGANADSKITVRDSWIEHQGNTLDGWVSQAAWGMGVSSGWDVRSEGNVYRAPFCAFSFHTNRAFSKPSYVENRNDRVLGTAADGAVAGLAFRAQPLGSGQRDKHVIIGCEVVGDYFYNPAPWMPTTLAYQPAAHTEIDVSGYGNTPFVFRISDFGRALKIASTTEAGSSIAVSGSAASVLLGEVTSYSGVQNLPAYVHGSFDISGTAVGPTSNLLITSLGKRLGDCTSVSKVLQVVVNGGAPLVIPFTLNYTDISNATILAEINAVLGSNAVATEYALGNRYRPRFSDEEQTLENASGVGIPMGTVLAFDSTYKRVRAMTSADPASLFAGVAWEDIYPGAWGRVKTAGYLPIGDVRRTGSAALVFGSTMSVGATPGVVAAGGTQGLLRAIRGDAVAIR